MPWRHLGQQAASASRPGAAAAVPFHVNVGRDTWDDAVATGTAARLREAGVTAVRDTCTYVTPVLARRDGAVMTDSAKWAWYAPGTIGVDPVFASTAECVRSAVAGRVVLDPTLWGRTGSAT